MNRREYLKILMIGLAVPPELAKPSFSSLAQEKILFRGMEIKWIPNLAGPVIRSKIQDA